VTPARLFLSRWWAGTWAGVADAGQTRSPMPVIDMSEAKNTPSRPTDPLEKDAEPEIDVIRDGRPAARPLPLDAPASVCR